MGDYEKILEQERIKNEAKAEKRKRRRVAYDLRYQAAQEMEELDAKYERKLIALDGVPASGAVAEQIFKERREAIDELEHIQRQRFAKTEVGKRFIRMKCAELERKRQPEIERAWAKMDYGRADHLIKERDAEVRELKRELRGTRPSAPQWVSDEP